MPLADIRDEWRATPCTAHDWTKSADQKGCVQGECRGELCESAGFLFEAYMKPGAIGALAWTYPAPAYEKIAADIAHDLGCPVPACQIWNRPAPVPANYAHYCSMSLREFPNYYSWGMCIASVNAANADPVTKQLVGPILAQASGMLVLDTWLGQGDRGNHPANVQLGYDSAEPQRSQLVFLDFSRTMNWNGQWTGNNWHNVVLVHEPAALMNCISKARVKETYDKIMAMSEDQITEIVQRLAGPNFPDAVAAHTAEALIGRRPLLAGPISAYT
jgi:hypothetical protein